MSNLLSQASLVMIPSGYKEDVVYSQIPTSGAGDLTFTRASNGTRVNSAGLVEVAPWNLLDNSETIGVSPWAMQNCSVTGNTTTAPNGTTTAETLAEDSNTSRKLLYQDRTIVANQEITLTIYVKANTLQYIRLIANDLNENFRWFGAQFNLTALTYTSATGSNGNATFTSASITDAGNGWYRISVSGTINTTSLVFGIFPSNGATLSSSDDRGGNTYLGTGKTAYIWGAQLNIGSTAKPYFPTTDRLNVPRLTYQNGGGGCPSLLLEKQSTNLVTYSEDFTNAAWNKGGTTITANTTISPDGTQNADTLSDGTSNTVHYVSTLATGFGQNGDNTFTIYAKANTLNYLWVYFYNGSESSGKTAWFNLADGTIGTIQSGLTASIENMGSGWYRCSITRNFNFTVAYSNCGFGISNADNVTTYLGTNKSIYVWGAQCEASSYKTSYIPTTSSSATRVADDCGKSAISSLIGQTEGVLFVDLKNPSGGDIASFGLNSSNTIYIVGDYNNSWGAGIIANSVNYAFTTVSNSASRIKIALAYKSGDSVLYINGVQVQQITSSFSFSASLSSVRFLPSAFYFSGPQNATYNQVAIFKTRLTNAELASLTTI